MNSSNVNICFSDLEPDDMIALWLLPEPLKMQQWIFVVGEGDSFFKASRMREILNDPQMGFNKYRPSDYHTIIVGFQPDKDLPGEKPDSERTNIQSTENVISNVKTALKTVESTGGRGFMLKPATELFQMFLNGDNVRYNIPWVWYGSFNLRSLIFRYNEKPETINRFVDEVGFDLIHESYLATGSQNSINGDEVCMSLFPSLIQDYMIVWNKYMAADCVRSINKIVRKQDPMFTHKDTDTTSAFVGNEDAFFEDERERNYYHRNFKCLKDIINSNYLQFVFADMALMLVFRLRFYGNNDLGFVRQGKYHMLDGGHSSFVPLSEDTEVTQARTYHYVDGLNETGRQDVRQYLLEYLRDEMTAN